MQIVDALNDKYELKELLTFVGLARSSYYYRRQVCVGKKNYAEHSEKIEKIFKDNYCCYGYRRIYQELRHQGITLSEKVIRRIMEQKNWWQQASKNCVTVLIVGKSARLRRTLSIGILTQKLPIRSGLPTSQNFLSRRGKLISL